MQLTRLMLENWRNFRVVDVELQRRAFVIGPNACGKSNLLDAVRFLRDIADPQGGLARAVAMPSRRGVRQLRSLHARARTDITVGIEARLDDDEQEWAYSVSFGQDSHGRAVVRRESVRHGGVSLLARPDADDRSDPGRLQQTHLEQVSLNRAYRPLADALAEVRYLHLVPQLVRRPELVVGADAEPWGSDFMQRLAATPKRTRDARLRRIQRALQVAVPQLDKIELHQDERGAPHLRGLYQHWRANAAWQTEEQFSDGTLRLLGLLWSLLDGSAPLLLEEPELSLHTGVVRHMAQMLARATRRGGRQVILSTHSAELLDDEGIDGREVLVLEPASEGTTVSLGSGRPAWRAMLESGLTVAHAVLPHTAPAAGGQFGLFEQF